MMTTRQKSGEDLEKLDDKQKPTLGFNKNLPTTNSEFLASEIDWDPSKTCPESQQEWQIYWKLIGLDLDSTVSVTCQQKAEIMSVILRPRTTDPSNTITSTEVPRKKHLTKTNTTVPKAITNSNKQQTIGIDSKKMFNILGFGGGGLIVFPCVAFWIYRQCKSRRLITWQDRHGDSKENQIFSERYD